MSTYFWNSGPLPPASGGGGTAGGTWGGWGGMYSGPHGIQGGVPGGAVPPNMSWDAAKIASLQSMGLLPPNFTAPGAGGPTYRMPASGPGLPGAGPATSGQGWSITTPHAPLSNPTGSGTNLGPPPGPVGPPTEKPPWWDAFQQYVMGRFPQARNWFGPPTNPPAQHPPPPNPYRTGL